MIHSRFDLIPAVHAILRHGSDVLVLRRQGTGYGDGMLALPAGHIEHGEDAIEALQRELHEELRIGVERVDCQLVTVAHRAAESEADRESLDLVFDVRSWRGVPSIGEPSKCSELLWANPALIWHELLPHLRQVLRAVSDGEPLVTIGWEARR